MRCDVCGKNTATVHLTEIVDNQVAELHLCEECAKAKSLQMEQQFGLADLLAGLSDLGKPVEDQELLNAKCPNCGLGYGDFKKVGRLGCSECYLTFKKYLGPLLKKIHGSPQHVGKAPAQFSTSILAEKTLEELKAQLQEAIKAEAFEEAARLRDKIKELEKKT